MTPEEPSGSSGVLLTPMRGFIRRRSKPFPSKAPSQKIKLKKKPSLFKTHKAMMTVIGAVIFLATFFVRDGKQRELREEIDDIQGARRNLSLLKEMFRDELVWKGPDTGDEEVPQGATPEVAFRTILLRQLIEADHSLERMEAMTEATGEVHLYLKRPDDANRASSESWSKGESEVRKKLQSLTDEVLNASMNSQGSYLSSRERIHKLRLRVSEVAYQTGTVSGRIVQEADNLSLKAYERQSQLEAEITKWEYGGYLLFAIGFYLAIRAKLTGEDNPISIEDE